MNDNRINSDIKVPTVRLIDEHGNQVGIVSNFVARKMAEEAGLDLVEISPKANPPVCQIMDYGKFKYKKVKKEKEMKAKQFVVKLKEIIFHPSIQKNDYTYRVKQAKEFLESGHKVKASVVYRGREINYTQLGQDVLNNIISDLNGVAIVEEKSFEGKTLSIILRKV